MSGSEELTLAQAFEKLYQSGFEPREGQWQMAEAAFAAFANKQVAVLEGATGIGKTFAYLIAGLLALKPKQQLVIATATVTLQEQLMEKDLPLILNALSLPYSAALAKGRRRYVCLQKLYHYNEQAQFELNLMGMETPLKSSEEKRIQQLQKQLRSKSWSGDLDSLDEQLPVKLHMQLTTDSAGCAQQKCGYFQDCPFFKVRRQQQTADIIVTNHHLLLADIELGTGQLLPKPEKALYVLDEAHHFPETAINYFQGFLHFSSLQKWLNGLDKSLKNLPSYLHQTPEEVQEATTTATALADLSNQLTNLQADCFQTHSEEDERLVDFSSDVLEVLTLSRDHAHSLCNQLIKLRKHCNQDARLQSHEQFNKIIDALGFFIDRSKSAWKAFHLLSLPNKADCPPVAKWLSKSDELGTRICAGMTASSHFLPELWWDKIENGIVLCSATLRALNSFEYYLKQSGLNYYPQVISQAFSSNFPYHESRLIIPSMRTLPGGSELSKQYIMEVSEQMTHIFQQEQHGVLVLFTSQQLLEKVYEQIDPKWQAVILSQLKLNRTKLLKTHKNQIDKNQLSIIFGLQSFAEGVDLPGNYCKHVIIPRLPFAVPTTPIERTWYDWLTSQGQNAFYAHTLPRTSVKLTQYIGRLLRRKTDIGTITICDGRLLQKSYGKVILANLPNFQKHFPNTSPTP